VRDGQPRQYTKGLAASERGIRCTCVRARALWQERHNGIDLRIQALGLCDMRVHYFDRRQLA
jgi:hypothetical protein